MQIAELGDCDEVAEWSQAFVFLCSAIPAPGDPLSSEGEQRRLVGVSGDRRGGQSDQPHAVYLNCKSVDSTRQVDCVSSCTHSAGVNASRSNLP